MHRIVKFGLITLLLLLAAVFLGGPLIGRLVQGPERPQGDTELRFSEIPTPFVHRSDFDKALPFMALVAIDVNNDGIDEIFVGGGIGQQDALLQYDHGELAASPFSRGLEKSADDPTYGAASIDATGNSLPDLFVARQSGLYLYRNTSDGFFGTRVEVPFDEQSMPLSVALADLNHDGWVDLYLSNYIRPEYVEGETIFNNANYGGSNLLLLNNGDNTFTDITAAAGIQHTHNTFVSVFVDLDNDHDSDLVVAHDTGMPKVYRNNGDLTFTEVSLPVTYSYPMGIAVGDIDNDGLVDLYFSNVGNTLPVAMLRGDLRDDQPLHTDYMLLKNQGDMQFVDQAGERDAAALGFGWGVVASDFNLDMRMDYLLAQNYIRFPGVTIPGLFELYPGRLLQQQADGKFIAVEQAAGIANPHFGVNMVVTDFNQDGWPDVVLGNLDGPLRAFVNQGGVRHWLAVRFANSPAVLGSRLQLTLADGSTLRRDLVAGEGLGSDQSRTVLFGLGDQSKIESLTIFYPDGEIWQTDQVNVDAVLSAQRP